MKINSLNLQKGLGMAELIISLAILLILGALLVIFYVGYNQSLSFLTASENVNASAGAVVADMSSTIRLADQVLSSHNFSGTIYTTSSTTLVIELPTIDAAGTIQATKHDYVAYFMSGGIIKKITDADALSSRKTGIHVLSNVGTYLSFGLDTWVVANALVVTVDVRTSATVRSQTSQSQITQQIYLRNK